MKLIFNKAELLRGVNTVLKAVPSKTTLNILECILIDATTNDIKFTANDMELGIETIVDGEIVEKGMIALNAKFLYSLVVKLPDNGEVELTTNDNYETIFVCENTKINIVGKSGEDFSYLPVVEKNSSFELSQFTLKELIRQTIFSIADNENNKIMTGELFEINGNELKVVSLDGHRISIRKAELSADYEYKKVIVPGKTLNEISKILSGDTDNMVSIYVTQNHILFEFDHTKVVSRLIEGDYFKIDQMLSTDYSTKVRVNKKEFLASIDRCTLMITGNDNKPIIINIEDGVMELKVNSENGSIKDNVNIVKDGKDILIGFNPKFLLDALRVIDEEEVCIYLVNSKAPCFIRDEEGKYVYLVLPVNFNTV